MDADHALAEHAELVQVAYGRGPMLGEGALALVLSFRHVNVEGRAHGLRHLEARADHGGRGAMWAVGRGLDGDDGILRVSRDEIRGAPGRLVRLFPVAGGRPLPVVHGAREDQPDPHVARGPDDRLGVVVPLVLEIEEVHACGRAVQQHLREGEGGAEVNALAVEARGERVEYPIAPGHEIEVVSEPTQERLEGVAMDVDRAGEEEPAGETKCAGAVSGRRDVRDAPVGHVHGEPRLDAAAGIDEIGEEAHRRVDSTAPIPLAQ